jgi:epoxyqueuosine reductase
MRAVVGPVERERGGVQEASLTRGSAKLMSQPPYRIDLSTIQRFDARANAFGHARVEHRCDRSEGAESAHHEVTAREADPDGRQRELAEAQAAWAVERLLWRASSQAGAECGHGDSTRAAPYVFADPDQASADVKAVATRFGGSVVGITRVHPLWLYSHDGSGELVELPEGVQYAIVVAVAMPREQIGRSPGPMAAAATGRGYSAMAAVAISVAEYLRHLGYRAIPCGNDTALSIPLAVDAGLGTMGRSGLLLTSEYGPFVRLCKVFTDLPLSPDTPQANGAEPHCATCGRCAAACPAGAISDAPDPNFEITGPWNRPGVLRWPVNGPRCLAFWERNGASCATCIAVCPYGMGLPEPPSLRRRHA